MRETGTRLEKSVLTFGPAGRVAVTVAVLLPLWWFAASGIAGLVGFAMWAIFAVPRLLRDVWRPAVLPVSDLTKLGAQAKVEREVRERFEQLEVTPRSKDLPKRW